MKPAAIAVEIPIQRRLMSRTKTKGTAPSPVARAVARAAKVTAITPALTNAPRFDGRAARPARGDYALAR